MEPLPQKVLNWLHRVLQAQYQDVNRTYSDSAQVLTQFKTLRPSTDVFTFEDGGSALLLRLAGTLPVNFRGAVYAFPVSIWVPYEYPRLAPIVLITPARGMRIRPGQHVSGEGRFYHPFLAGWRPDRSNMLALIGVLQEVFAHEPPVIATSEIHSSSTASSSQNGGPPPRPPLPPELNRSDSGRETRQPSSLPQPPQLPPKPFQDHQQAQPQLNDGPPVPPRPSSQYDTGRSDGDPGRSSSIPQNPRYSQAPPLPTHSVSPRPVSNYQAAPNPQLQIMPPHQSPPQHYHPQQQQQPPPPQQSYYQPGQQPYPPNQPQLNTQHPHQYQPPQPNQRHAQQYPQAYPPPAQAPGPPQPPPDLLSDPFDQPLPTHSEPLPAPPIPPNPEKDALLHALSQTLTSRLQSAVHTNTSAIQPLAAQHSAMQAALYNLQGEKAALSALSSHLTANSELMGQAMREADACIGRASTASVPGLDEMLVAPMVVGQQVYELVAEVQACQSAREVLARALDRGRIGAEGWVRATRGIAREEFLKRVLVEKAAKGMGLRPEQHAVGSEGGWI